LAAAAIAVVAELLSSCSHPLNLYSYVRNNPIWRPDTDGHGFWTKLKNAFSGGGWNEDDEAQKERARRLHIRAEEARKSLSGATRMTIHGESPQMFVQGATDQELVDAQREVAEFLASKVEFPGQCPEGLQCGVVFPVGLPEEGASSEYTNITRGGAVTNIRTNITAGEFGATLEANGFVKSTASDGTLPCIRKEQNRIACIPVRVRRAGPLLRSRLMARLSEELDCNRSF
jgi:hypothetical protein